MKIIELTLSDKRRVGIPQQTSVIIVECAINPPAEHEKAKTMIRYTLGFNQARVAWVRDPFERVLNLFPKAVNGAGWQQAKDMEGNRVAFPEGSVGAFEEQAPKGDAPAGFRLTLNCETGPLDLVVDAKYEDVKAMLGEQVSEEDAVEDETAEEEAPAPAPRRRRGS